MENKKYQSNVSWEFINLIIWLDVKVSEKQGLTPKQTKDVSKMIHKFINVNKRLYK